MIGCYGDTSEIFRIPTCKDIRDVEHAGPTCSDAAIDVALFGFCYTFRDPARISGCKYFLALRSRRITAAKEENAVVKIDFGFVLETARGLVPNSIDQALTYTIIVV